MNATAKGGWTSAVPVYVALAVVLGVSQSLAAEGRISGRSLVVTDRTEPGLGRRTIVFRSRDPSLEIASDTAGEDPTARGGSLVLRNGAGGTESAVVPLPASGWRRVPSSANRPLRGWRYREAGETYSIDVRLRQSSRAAAKLLVVRIKQTAGDLVSYTLDEPVQGGLGVELAIGSSRQCASFGGTVTRDVSTALGPGAHVGTFAARDAPAPTSGCERRPNIIIVLTDDMNTASLAYMPTAIDRLAANGFSFSDAFVPTSICTPSRASLLQGRYARHTGVRTNGDVAIFDESQSLALWLQTVGYSTGLFGKYLNGYGSIAPHVPAGWDRWVAFRDAAYYDYTLVADGVDVAYGSEPSAYSTDVLATYLLDFIDEHAAEPFFALLAPSTPHLPATPAPRHVGAYAGLAPWMPPSWNEADVSDKPGYVRLFGTDGSAEAFRISQLESLLAVDEAIAAILDRLEARGIVDDTLIVLTSDHGHLWMEHRLATKEVPYEESVRIPLVISYPRWTQSCFPAGCTESRMVVGNIDLTATAVELAAARSTQPLDGLSLAGLVTGAPPPVWRDDMPLEYFGGIIIPAYEGVRTADGWKYVRYPNGFTELYDLVSDPWELDNLRVVAPDDPTVQAVLSQLAARTDELLSQ